MKTKVVVFKTGRELQEFLKGVEYMPSMFNRKVKDSHVKNMTRSIKEIGIQRVFNIIESKSFGGVKTLYYADGQHLGKGVLNIPEGDLKGGFVAFINKVENIENIIIQIIIIQLLIEVEVTGALEIIMSIHGIGMIIYFRGVGIIFII